MSIFSLADSMGCPPPGAVTGVHRHHPRPVVICKKISHLVSGLRIRGRRRAAPVLSSATASSSRLDRGACQCWFVSRWTLRAEVRRRTGDLPGGWFSQGCGLLRGHPRGHLVGRTRESRSGHTRGLFHSHKHPSGGAAPNEGTPRLRHRIPLPGPPRQSLPPPSAHGSHEATRQLKRHHRLASLPRPLQLFSRLDPSQHYRYYPSIPSHPKLTILAIGLLSLLSGAMAWTMTCSSSTQANRAPVPVVAGASLESSGGHPLRLLGVNATGTENACVLDDGFGWGPMNRAEAAAIASWHTNAVRVPLNEDCWLGINGAPAPYSGPAYRHAIKSWVATLNAAGLVAILDLHWAAPGPLEATEQWPMADAEHSITFWTQVATSFKAWPSVIFDLYNEPDIGGKRPTSKDWACWLQGCTLSHRCSTCVRPITYRTAGVQQLLDAVRRSGASQPTLVAGLEAASDPCGINDYPSNGGRCMWLSYMPFDPLHQLLVSFHNYQNGICVTTSCWNANIKTIASHVPVVTTELGETDCSASYIDRYMNWADKHDISYLAWAWVTPPPSVNKCAAANLDLLQSFDGSPSRIAPAGKAYKRHLAHLAHLFTKPQASRQTLASSVTLGEWLLDRRPRISKPTTTSRPGT